LPPRLPKYFKREYENRRGRPGHRRLWVAKEFGNIDCSDNDWEGPLGQAIPENCGGIVIYKKDIERIRPVGGLITDAKLNVI